MCPSQHWVFVYKCHCCTYPQLVSANFLVESLIFKFFGFFLACKPIHCLAKFDKIPIEFDWWGPETSFYCWIKTTSFVANKNYIYTQHYTLYALECGLNFERTLNYPWSRLNTKLFSKLTKRQIKLTNAGNRNRNRIHKE